MKGRSSIFIIVLFIERTDLDVKRKRKLHKNCLDEKLNFFFNFYNENESKVDFLSVSCMYM